MTLRLTGAALLVSLLLPTLAAAQPLPTIETLKLERGIEWGDYHAQLTLTLTRQADGSYLADVGGEDYAETKGLVVSETALKDLKQALWALRDLPDDSFAGEGNHWYTSLDLVGAAPDGQPWRLKRWCFDTNSDRLHRLITSLEEAADQLIKKLLAASTPAPAAGMTSALGAGS
jgi:hypothetical protein